MKFSIKSIPFVIATALAISTPAAYSQTSNDLLSQASPPYPSNLCSTPYFCLPYPSNNPYTVCKPYAIQGPNGPLFFYRCIYYVPGDRK
jgi:hypothetical protein